MSNCTKENYHGDPRFDQIAGASFLAGHGNNYDFSTRPADGCHSVYSDGAIVVSPLNADRSNYFL